MCCVSFACISSAHPSPFLVLPFCSFHFFLLVWVFHSVSKSRRRCNKCDTLRLSLIFFFINWWWWWWWCWCMCCVVYLYTCRTRMQSIPFCERGNQPIFFLSSDLFFSILLHLSLSLAGLSIKTFFSLFSPLLFLLVFVHLFKKDSSCVSIAVFWGDGCFYISRGVFWFLNVPGIVCTVYD